MPPVSAAGPVQGWRFRTCPEEGESADSPCGKNAECAMMPATSYLNVTDETTGTIAPRCSCRDAEFISPRNSTREARWLAPYATNPVEAHLLSMNQMSADMRRGTASCSLALEPQQVLQNAGTAVVQLQKGGPVCLSPLAETAHACAL